MKKVVLIGFLFLCSVISAEDYYFYNITYDTPRNNVQAILESYEFRTIASNEKSDTYSFHISNAPAYLSVFYIDNFPNIFLITIHSEQSESEMNASKQLVSTLYSKYGTPTDINEGEGKIWYGYSSVLLLTTEKGTLNIGYMKRKDYVPGF